jgi:hypothetical protein
LHSVGGPEQPLALALELVVLGKDRRGQLDHEPDLVTLDPDVSHQVEVHDAAPHQGLGHRLDQVPDVVAGNAHDVLLTR